MNARAEKHRCLSDERGFSRVEVVCIAGISLIAAAVLVAVGWYALTLMQRGNDANALNTAESVAYARVPATCLADGCSGEGDPQHAQHVDAQGNNVVYYSKESHTLVPDMPAGYNEGDLLVVDGREQQVERGAYVIQVTVDAKTDAITCVWVRAS